MGFIGGWALLKNKHPEVRRDSSDVAEVNAALGFTPSEFFVDGCVIIVILWKRNGYGSVYALAAASALPALATKLAKEMLEYIAEFLDQRVPEKWFFDGREREGVKNRYDPAKVAEHINNALRLYYLSCSHGARGQALELMNRWVTPDHGFIEAVACNISKLLAARQGGSVIMCKGEADYPMAQYLEPNTAVVTSDSDIWGFTEAKAVVVPQKK